jgi:[NiFe] hydrogenase diaphorase moiety large subunit
MQPFCSMNKIVKKDGQEVVVCDDVRSYLMDTLQKIQEEEGYISDENIQKVADQFGLHPVEVYSVITFYSFLSTEPKGKNIIRISNCMPCVLKGNDKIIEAFEKKIGVKCGQTTKDGKFTLEKTSCIGMCDKAPAVMVNDKLVGPVKAEDIDRIISELK